MATASDHFSRFSQAEVHTRNLPHWAANATIIFITYRLADSMPADKLRQCQSERDEWLRFHPEPWDEATASEYYDTFPAKLDEWLDAGYGSCILAREDCRRIVAENLLHFNGARYRLHAFVMMPNHVHVLVEIANRDDLPKIVHGWKSYAANRMSEAIGGSGSVWQREYYEASSSSARVPAPCCCSGESGLHKRLKFDKSSASTIIVMVCAPRKRCAPKRRSTE